MEVLPDCVAVGRYAYTGTERKGDRVLMRNADDVYANIPVHAAEFAGKVATDGALAVDMTIVGHFQSGRSHYWVDELGGDCHGVSHVVTGLTVGAFRFYSGARATTGASVSVGTLGGGGDSEASRETLLSDGDEAACVRSTGGDATPPEGCGALLRLELSPLDFPDSLRGLPFCRTEVGPCDARCDAGSPVACAMAGRMYMLGEGAPRDEGRALTLDQRSCEGGYPGGCAALGLLYIGGRGVATNEPRGRELEEEACSSGFDQACVYLGGMYMLVEHGVTKNASTARDYFTKACRLGHKLSCAVATQLRPGGMSNP
ncbi:MAG: tetratricopeptide repeat protein, partial [Polyangiaceae bacterium]